MHFEKIRLYLKRLRDARYTMLQETDDVFQFEIKIKHVEKLFTVQYRDVVKDDSLDNDWSSWYHYYLQFEQRDVPNGDDGFCDIEEGYWYPDEDAVLYRIQTLTKKYKY